MRWSNTIRSAFAGVCALALVAAGAAAQDRLAPQTEPVAARKAPARFDVTVLQAKRAPGGVDARAGRINQLLAKRGLSYGTLRVVAQQQADLMLGEIGAVMTPNGKEYRFRPLDRGATGFLVAIDWGSTRVDYRMEPGVPLLLGGQPKDGFELWVVLELR